MKMQISKELKKLLAAPTYDPRWNIGPFAGLKKHPAKAKGWRGENIAKEVFRYLTLKVEEPTSRDYDMILEGKPTETKASMITDKSDDKFSFMQIRPDQDYAQLLLQTFLFDGTIEYYLIPKKDIEQLIKDRVFLKQHGGNKAESRTFLYTGTMKPFKKYFWFRIKLEDEKAH